MTDQTDLAQYGGDDISSDEPAAAAGARGMLPLDSFDAACDAVLDALDDVLGMQLVMVTRVLGERQVVLAMHDTGYGLRARHTFAFEDTMCARMIDGRGEHVCADVAAHPGYATAPVRDQMEVGAYAGVPLLRPDGSVFGTLAAMHPSALGRDIENAAPLLRVLARLLSAVLARDLEPEVRSAGGTGDRGGADHRGERDLRTGLLTRSAWETIIEHEERRCQRLESPASVLVLGLVGPRPWEPGGEQQLTATATALEAVLRRSDAIARIGADEFAVLAVGTDERGATRVQERLQERLDADGIPVAFGMAVRTVDGLAVAFRSADVSMDDARRARQNAQA
ncbi:MAG TPA: diguanylate cyclase [Acidimicrobiales bacterium]